jgi:hypothetical protein
MHKLNRAVSIRKMALAAGLASLSALPLSPALADSGTGDKAADMMLDLLVLRPLGLLATGVGSVALVVSLPFTLPSGSVGETACELVREPFSYTFTRRLGDLEGDGKRCAEAARR